jgi:formate hydrogenlyase subunit 3/multisubunit Na+/H+ antiporter MnhD subunit
MSDVAFAVMAAGFLWGVIAAVAWPSHVWARQLSLVGAAIGSAAAIALAATVFAAATPWVRGLSVLVEPLGGLVLTLDRLGAFFLALVGITGCSAVIYAFGYERALGRHAAGRVAGVLLNTFLAGMCLVPAAGNVLSFLMGWELMAVASYLLVMTGPQHDDTQAAGLWYAVMTHAGFFALLAAFLTVAQGASFDFSAIRAARGTLTPSAQLWVFVLGLLAFGSKAGLVPLHVWLPRAHPAAPSHISALMSAAMVKLGVYGALRLFFDLMPEGPAWWGGVVIILGLVTALTGVLYTVAEPHLKRALAYSTIENVGIIFVGVGYALLMRGYGYRDLAALGLLVALLHAFNHAIFKTLLFLGAGAVIHQVHSPSLEAYGGLIRRMPQTAALCLIGVLSLAALPPFNGFPSEWLTFQFLVVGARQTAPELAILLPLALGGVALTAGLAAVSAVRLFGITFLALPRSNAAAASSEVALSMRLAMAIPAIACVVFGVLPGIPLTALGDVAGELHMPLGALEVGLSLGVPLVGSRMSPSALALTIAGCAIAVAALARRRGPIGRVDDAWNCGRIGQSARSEYTAGAFAEPLNRVFVAFYRPAQQVTVDTHPVSPYFVRAIAYRGRMVPWLEQVLYAPIVRVVLWTSRAIRKLQAGSIHLYLAYLVTALVVALFLSYWVP